MRVAFGVVGFLLLTLNLAQAQTYRASLPIGFSEVKEDMRGLLAQGYRLVTVFPGGGGGIRANTFVLDKPGSAAICVIPDKDVKAAYPNAEILCGVL